MASDLNFDQPAAIVAPAETAQSRIEAELKPILARMGNRDRLQLEDCFPAGDLLVKLKAECKKGTWGMTLQRLGITDGAAWMYMEIASSPAPRIQECKSIRDALDLAAKYKYCPDCANKIRRGKPPTPGCKACKRARKEKSGKKKHKDEPDFDWKAFDATHTRLMHFVEGTAARFAAPLDDPLVLEMKRCWQGFRAAFEQWCPIVTNVAPPVPAPDSERDLLWDAIVKVTGLDASTGKNASFIGQCRKQLLGATVPYTPQEVLMLPIVLGKLGHKFPVTIGVIEKYIGNVRTQPAGGKREETIAEKNARIDRERAGSNGDQQ